MTTPVSLYRTFSKTIALLPKKYLREEAMLDLRTAYSAPAPTSESGMAELMESGLKRLAFLQMQTRGKREGAFKVRYTKDTQTGEITKEEGVVLPPGTVGKEGEGKARYSNWHGGNMDPESVQRHNRSLARGGWKSNSQAKGNF